ncbi:MAG: beta-galactosidase [Myxococcota bacterium]|nr:beta-galactosidase [Myxococcota bacterium]
MDPPRTPLVPFALAFPFVLVGFVLTFSCADRIHRAEPSDASASSADDSSVAHNPLAGDSATDPGDAGGEDTGGGRSNESGGGNSDASDGTMADGSLQDAAAACAALSVVEPFSMSIAGQWDFIPASQVATKIQVPGGGWVKQGFTVPSATYQTRITIPDAGAPQTTLLEFGAINHQATLSVDGVVVGTNTTSFTPSVFDVSKYVRPGQQHLISLLVKGRNALKNSAGKDTVPAAADWSPYVPQGIFRSAMVRVYPDIYVSDVFVRTSVKSDSLSYDVSVTNSGAVSRQVTLSGTLDSWNCDPRNYPTIPSTQVTVAPGATQTTTIGPVPWGLGSASYWWPNVPYQAGYKTRLHDLRIGLGDGSKILQTRLVRFGFREIEQRQADPQHAYYYLNGVRVNFRGDSLQGVDYDSIDNGAGFGDAYDTFAGFLPPSPQNPGFPQAIRNYQRLNFNVIRIHQELASPYMLDVADELGQMIIDETAIRGTDGQDFVIGHDNMVNHARALVLRDRNHPSVIRYSQSNEENLSSTDSIQFATDLYNAITALDTTRPVSADLGGNGRAYDAIVHPNFSAYGHYITGLGLYSDDVAARTDRPFGQGELIWPNDVTPQGMMWFATSTMSMRAKDASEIRPYTLLSAWASVIPGVTTAMMRLEPTYPQHVVNPPLFGEDNLPDPWSHPTVMRIQRAFSPVLAADPAYWEPNKMSNAKGEWPIALPGVARGVDLSRSVIVFNDTFTGTRINVVWEVHSDAPAGPMGSSGTFAVDVPNGSRMTQAITIHTPTVGTTFYLVFRAQKDGLPVFEDTAEAFTLN